MRLQITRIAADEDLQDRRGYVVEQAGARAARLVGDLFGEWTAGDEIPGGLAGQRVLAPVVPSKIVAVALNYKAHAAEQGKPLPPEPLFFLKPSTAVIGPGEPSSCRRASGGSTTRPKSASSSAAARGGCRPSAPPSTSSA